MIEETRVCWSSNEEWACGKELPNNNLYFCMSRNKTKKNGKPGTYIRRLCKKCDNKRAIKDMKRNYKENPDRYAIRNLKKDRELEEATPKWLPREMEKAVYNNIKRHASWLKEQDGLQRDIDHIIPLKGKTVCGFHCASNWAVSLSSENRSKSNKFEQSIEFMHGRER